VAREVEEGRLGESALGRLATVEAELRRGQQTLEEILREEYGRG
jgi:hypothetical protein